MITPAEMQTCYLQVLVIIAASHLDAVTFQIGSQSFKILPTALFAAWLLNQRLSGMQWGSLPVGHAATYQLLTSPYNPARVVHTAWTI